MVIYPIGSKELAYLVLLDVLKRKKRTILCCYHILQNSCVIQHTCPGPVNMISNNVGLLLESVTVKMEKIMLNASVMQHLS